jgi:four helix bundle protein
VLRNGYRDLIVWQRGMDIVADVYRVTAAFPDHERFGLTAQMRRPAVSIPSNIAEGHARASTKEFLRYVSVAQGSRVELETQLMIAQRLAYGGDAAMDELLQRLHELGRMLTSLRHSLRKRVKPAE